jgi:hypothetical protein
MSQDSVILNIAYNIPMTKFKNNKKLGRKFGWSPSDFQSFKDGDRLRSYRLPDSSKKASKDFCRVFKWSHTDWDEC